MKQFSILLLSILVAFSSCTKEEDDDPITNPTEKLNPTAAQKGFALEWTSITCAICGSSGAAIMEKFSNDAPKGAIIALHVNVEDSMKIPNSVYWQFSEDRPTDGGIPRIYVADEKVYTSDDSAVINLMGQGNAVAGIDLSYKVIGNTMTVKTLTRFFTNATGDYKLSVYVLEDGIFGGDNAPLGYEQSGGSDDYNHNFVYRTNANQTMGELIASDPVSDTEIEETYSITLDSDWENVYPVAVLWKYDASASIKHSYVNSIRKK